MSPYCIDHGSIVSVSFSEIREVSYRLLQLGHRSPYRRSERLQPAAILNCPVVSQRNDVASRGRHTDVAELGARRASWGPDQR